MSTGARCALCTVVLACIAVQVAAAQKPFVSDKGYQMTPPAGWSIARGAPGHADVFFYAPEAGGFKPNVNMLVQPPDSSAPLSVIAKNLSKIMEQSVPGYHTLSEKIVTLVGHKAIHLMGNLNPPNFKKTLRMDQYYIPTGDHVYVITLTALQGQASSYEAAFAGVIKSLKLTH